MNKRWWMGGLALVLAVTLLGCGTEPADSGNTEPTDSGSTVYEFGTWEEREAALADPNGRLMIMAHRGYWSDTAPENSMAALEAAYALGVDMVELDVYTTADDQLVLSHDESLKRTTNVAEAFQSGLIESDRWSYQVSALPLSEIKKLRLKAGEGGDDAPLTDQPVLTLKEALTYCRGRMFVNIDAKGADWKRVMQDVTECDAWSCILHNFGGSTMQENEGAIKLFELTNGVKVPRVWSLNGDTMEIVIQKAKSQLAPTMYQMPYYVSVGLPCLSWEAVEQRTYDLGVLFNKELTEAVVGKTRMQAMTMSSWGELMGQDYDCEAVWEKLIDHGFTVLMTDHPAELCAYRWRRFGVGYPT